MSPALQRAGVSMRGPEVDAFLREPARTMAVATLLPSGAVHLSAVWYGFDDAGRVGFTAHESSQKIRNLERDDRISVLVEVGEEYGELRGVQVIGRAALVRDGVSKEAISRSVHARYRPGRPWRDPGESMARRVAVIVYPEKVASWDHTKMRDEITREPAAAQPTAASEGEPR